MNKKLMTPPNTAHDIGALANETITETKATPGNLYEFPTPTKKVAYFSTYGLENPTDFHRTLSNSLLDRYWPGSYL